MYRSDLYSKLSTLRQTLNRGKNLGKESTTEIAEIHILRTAIKNSLDLIDKLNRELLAEEKFELR